MFCVWVEIEMKEGVPKFNVGATTPRRTPYAETFTYAPSTWQDKTASQILASYLYASLRRSKSRQVVSVPSRRRIVSHKSPPNIQT